MYNVNEISLCNIQKYIIINNKKQFCWYIHDLYRSVDSSFCFLLPFCFFIIVISWRRTLLLCLIYLLKKIISLENEILTIICGVRVNTKRLISRLITGRIQELSSCLFSDRLKSMMEVMGWRKSRNYFLWQLTLMTDTDRQTDRWTDRPTETKTKGI